MKNTFNYLIPIWGLIHLSENFLFSEDLSDSDMIKFVVVSYVQAIVLGAIAIAIFWSWL